MLKGDLHLICSNHGGVYGVPSEGRWPGAATPRANVRRAVVAVVVAELKSPYRILVVVSSSF